MASHPTDDYRLSVAVLAAGIWQRMAVLLPVIALLWAAIGWALAGE